MVRMSVIGSSSRGNCYLLDADGETLIIEAGIPFKGIKEALGYNLKKAVGCLVTHRHGDHAKSVGELVRAGITTLALEDVFDFHGVGAHKSRKIIEPKKGYKIGSFKVYTFPANHDVPCVGFLISHDRMGGLMFLTDSYTCQYRFSGLNHILIECNYSDKALTRAIAEGRTFAQQRARLIESHMELSTCKMILETSDLSDTKEIVLLHLSENNSEERAFVDEIQCLTGKPTYVAKSGLELDFTSY